MLDVAGRLRAAATALLTALLLVILVLPSITQAVDPPNLDRFMAALGAVESNGRYDAVNSTTGAIGKYQIMPANWGPWALRYTGDANSAPTPQNQDRIARGKLIALYSWFGDWGSVAHWWLTGDGDTNPDHWSAFSIHYVNNVLALMGKATLTVRGPAPAPVTANPKPRAVAQVFDESSREVHFSGGWGQAEYAGYNGGQVRYAVEEGATAWFTFTGRSITWVGPKGPTRGKARIYLDEELVATVDVYSSRFQPRADLFTRKFDRLGTQTITIEVLGTPGRPTVALDEFDVTS